MPSYTVCYADQSMTDNALKPIAKGFHGETDGAVTRDVIAWISGLHGVDASRVALVDEHHDETDVTLDGDVIGYATFDDPGFAQAWEEATA